MLSELKRGSRVVGAKQTKRAIAAGRAMRVFLAVDADPRVTEPVGALCHENQIAVADNYTMAELGAACEIAVGCAVAALIK